GLAGGGGGGVPDRAGRVEGGQAGRGKVGGGGRAGKPPADARRLGTALALVDCRLLAPAEPGEVPGTDDRGRGDRQGGPDPVARGLGGVGPSRPRPAGQLVRRVPSGAVRRLPRQGGAGELALPRLVAKRPRGPSRRALPNGARALAGGRRTARAAVPERAAHRPLHRRRSALAA